MKRQLNFRFLLILLAFTGILAAGGHLLHGRQVKRNAGYLLTQSKLATSQKDYPTALRYLSHYLTLRPEDGPGRARYGVMLAKLAKTRREKEQAFLILERALRDDPELEQVLRDDPESEQNRKQEDQELASLAKDLANVRLRAVELAMDLNQFPDAKVHLELMLKDRPNDAELLQHLGRCEESGGRAKSAVEAYEKAIAAEPSRVEAYSRLAALHRRAKQDGEADQIVVRLIKANPDSVRARLAAVRYYRLLGQIQAARTNLTAVQQTETNRGDKDVLLAGADLALFERKDEEARATLQLGIKTYPNEPQFYLVLAGLELRVGNRSDAIKHLQDVRKVLPKQSAEAWAVADLLIDANAMKEARELVEILGREQADGAALDFLNARIHLIEGRPKDAEGLLQKCRREFARNPDIALRTELLLGACYEQLDKPDLRLAAAQLAIKIDPTSVPARLSHANALLAADKVDDALVVYKSLLDRDSTIRLTIARVVNAQNASRPVADRNLALAYEVLDGAPDDLKKTVGYHLARAQTLVAEGTKPKLDAARRVVEAARNQYPKEPRLWMFLAEVAATTSPASGFEILDLAQAEIGENVLLRVARVTLIFRAAERAGQKPDPAGLRSLETGAGQLLDAEQTQFYRVLAEAHLRAGSAADAERLLRLVVERHPGNLGVLARLFEVVSAKENPAEMVELIDKLRLAEGPEGSFWRFAEAFESWLRYRKDKDAAALLRARTRLAEAGKQRPDWFRIPLLEAEIEEHERRPDAAIEKYLRAIRLGASQPNLIVRVASLLSSRGRHDEVRTMIDSAHRRAPAGTPELERLDVLNLVKLGEDPDQVIRRLEQVAPEKSTDSRDHYFRGVLYASLDRSKEAESALRRALELKPEAAEAWVALVRLLVQTKRDIEAKAEIEKAARAIPADKKAAALGACHEAVGDRAEAEKQYIQAAQDGASDPAAQRNLAVFYIGGGEVAKAEPILRRLVAGEPTRRWARRTLATAYAGTNDYAQGTEAIALLDANLRESPGEPEELFLRSLILASRPGTRGQSIKDLEASFSRMSPEPSAEFLLAQLYELDGNWAKANDLLRGLLVRRGGNNPAYIAYYVRALIRRKQIPDAETWFARLEAKVKDKDSPAVVELRARIDVAKMDRMKAAGDLKRFAQEAFKKGNNPNVLRSVGLVMDDLKLFAEAEDMLKQYVAAAEAKTPAAVLVFADFLARQHRVPEALTTCSNALAKVNPELVARVTVGVVRLGEASDAQFLQAETILQKAAQAKPESVDISISLADLRDAQGRYDDAKLMYREILQRAPRTVLAMNNLAWLLALNEGNHDEALQTIDRAIGIQGPDGNLLDTRGVIMLTTGKDPAQAVVDLTAAVAQEPLPERYFHLAQAHQKAGNTLEALRLMRKARDLDPPLSKKHLHRLEWTSFDSLNGLIEVR